MITEHSLIRYLISMIVGYSIGALIILLLTSRLWLNFCNNLYGRIIQKIHDYRDKRSYRKTIKELHAHPEIEAEDGVIESMVLVDAKFEPLFTRVFTYWGDGLILVDREEYIKLKTSIYKQR